MPDHNSTQKHLTMTLLMTPDYVNFSGKVHGGAILKLLDQVAYACASKYCGFYVVTLSVDQVIFKQPIYLGELVTFLASVNHTGRTSMEIGIKLIAEDIHSKVARHVVSCYFTMVAVDDKGASVPVPALMLTTDNERARFAAAIERKKIRTQFEALHTATRNSGTKKTG